VGRAVAASIGRSFNRHACPRKDFRTVFFLRKSSRNSVSFHVPKRTDVRRSGEQDREELRRRAAHAGPIDDDTLLYRIEFHVVA